MAKNTLGQKIISVDHICEWANKQPNIEIVAVCPYVVPNVLVLYRIKAS